MTDQTSTPTDAPPCTACRGTGKVISRLGGEPRPMECPWCEGTGRRLAAHNAQDRGGDGDRPNGDGDGPPDIAA